MNSFAYICGMPVCRSLATPSTRLPSPPQGVWQLGPIPLRAYALCMVCAQEGVDALVNSGLPVRLVTAVIDPSLNEDAYIVPGLGDAGDRPNQGRSRRLRSSSGQ